MKLSKVCQVLALAGVVLSTVASAEMVLRRGNGSEPQSLDPQISF